MIILGLNHLNPLFYWQLYWPFDWLKSLNPPWQRGRSPGSLHTAPAMLGGRGVTEAKHMKRLIFFGFSAKFSANFGETMNYYELSIFRRNQHMH